MGDKELEQQVKELDALYKKYRALLLQNFDDCDKPIRLANIAGDLAWLVSSLNRYRIEAIDKKDLTTAKKNVTGHAIALLKEIDACFNTQYDFHSSDWYDNEGKSLLQEMRKIAEPFATPKSDLSPEILVKFEALTVQHKALHDYYDKFCDLIIKQFPDDDDFIIPGLSYVSLYCGGLSWNLNQYRISIRDRSDSTTRYKENVTKNATDLIKAIGQSINEPQFYHKYDWYSAQAKPWMEGMRAIAATFIAPVVTAKPTIVRF